jgi:nitrate reductase assembly molybdenum cofactor insertion protein NarJ
MLSLDEAIKHCEEVAEEQENKAKSYPRPDKSVKGSGRKYNACIKCANEHRQLAEWLKELKAYKEERVSCEYCKYNDRQEHERPCSLCKHNFKDMFEGSDGE